MRRYPPWVAAVVLVVTGFSAPATRAQDGVIESGRPGCPERAVVGLIPKSVQLYNDDGAAVVQLAHSEKLSPPIQILKCVKSNIFMINYQGRKLFVFRHQVVADTKFEIPCAELSGTSETLQTAGAPAIIDNKCKTGAKQ